MRVQNHQNVSGLQKNVFFLTHSILGTSDPDKTLAKCFEPDEFAVQLAKYLHKQGYTGSQV
jgi:hypothetical protein